MNLNALLATDASFSQRLSIPPDAAWRRRLAGLFAHSGDSWFWLVALAGVWILGGDAGKAWALRMAVSIVGLAVVVLALKQIIRRQRPEGEWGRIYRATDPHSFPSGHAARCFLLATLIAGWGPVTLGPWMVLWACLVSLSRVALGVHYLSDVLAGALLGVAAGMAALSFAPSL